MLDLSMGGYQAAPGQPKFIWFGNKGLVPFYRTNHNIWPQYVTQVIGEPSNKLKNVDLGKPQKRFFL